MANRNLVCWKEAGGPASTVLRVGFFLGPAGCRLQLFQLLILKL